MAPRRSPHPRPAPVAPGRVCVAEIGAPHGIAGEVRLRAFTAEPLAVTHYGELQAEDGRSFAIAAARAAKDCLIVRLAGVADRTAAERLRNLKLYVPRERLPAIEEPDTYYHADLVGLAVVGPDGAALGRVRAIQNFGAGDLIEVAPEGGGATMLLPFTDAVVPVIDLQGGRVVINPPLEAGGNDTNRDKSRPAVPRVGGAPSKRRRRNSTHRPVVTGSSAFADDDGS